jgi:hypothetical protein
MIPTDSSEEGAALLKTRRHRPTAHAGGNGE